MTPAERGRTVAGLFARMAPALFRDIEESGLLPLPDAGARERARREWDAFALYACVRGLVAAGGFNRESGEALHSGRVATCIARRPSVIDFG